MEQDLLTTELYQECLDLVWRHLKYPSNANPVSSRLANICAEAANAAIHGDYQEAGDTYAMAMTVHQDARAACGLACAFVLDNRLTEARGVIRRTDPSTVDCVDNVFDLAVLARHLGLYEKAMEAHTRLRQITMPDYRHLCETAFLYARMGNLAAAADAAREAEEAAPSTLDASKLLAAAYRSARLGPEALRHITSTLTASSSSLDWYVAVAQLADAQKFDAAQLLVSRALAVHPLDGMLHGLMGDVRYAQTEWSAAAEAYEQALSLLPDTTEEARWKSLLHRRRARALFRLDHLLPACDSLRMAVELDPENGEARLLLGEAQKRLGRADEALASWRLVAASGDLEGVQAARDFIESIS